MIFLKLHDQSSYTDYPCLTQYSRQLADCGGSGFKLLLKFYGNQFWKFFFNSFAFLT